MTAAQTPALPDPGHAVAEAAQGLPDARDAVAEATQPLPVVGNQAAETARELPDVRAIVSGQAQELPPAPAPTPQAHPPPKPGPLPNPKADPGSQTDSQPPGDGSGIGTFAHDGAQRDGGQRDGGQRQRAAARADLIIDRQPARPGDDVVRGLPVQTGGTPGEVVGGTGRSVTGQESENALTRVIEVLPGWLAWVLGASGLMALALGATAVVAARRARALRGQREMLLADIGFLQQALLPALPEHTDGVNVTVAYEASAGLVAGGDFYDVATLADGRTAVILGDVSGHGKDAVAHAALVRHTVRAYLDAGYQPRETLEIASSSAAGALDGHFATVIVAIFDPARNQLVFASAGHPWPLDAAGAVVRREPVSPPLGVGAPTGLRQSTVYLAEQVPLLLFTDGLSEARVDEDKLLGEARVRELLAALGPRASARRVLRSVRATARRTPDDMAACVLTATRPSVRPGRWAEEMVAERTGCQLLRFLANCEIGSAAAEAVSGEADRLLGTGAERVLVEVGGAPGEQPLARVSTL